MVVLSSSLAPAPAESEVPFRQREFLRPGDDVLLRDALLAHQLAVTDWGQSRQADRHRWVRSERKGRADEPRRQPRQAEAAVEIPGTALGPLDDDLLDEIAAAADDPSDAALVLLSPPARQVEPGDLFTSALRSGFPVVLWHPHADEESLRRAIEELTADGGLVDLPRRVRDVRLATERSSRKYSTYSSLIRDLVVLWDDPDRIIPLVPDLPTAEQE
jgi:hypothetical protein